MRNKHRAGTTNALGTSPIKLCPSEPPVLACLSFTSPSRTVHDIFRSSLPFIPMNFSKRYTLPSHALVLNLPPRRPNPLRTSTLITGNHPSPPPSRKMTSFSLLPPGLENPPKPAHPPPHLPLGPPHLPHHSLAPFPNRLANLPLPPPNKRQVHPKRNLPPPLPRQIPLPTDIFRLGEIRGAGHPHGKKPFRQVGVVGTSCSRGIIKVGVLSHGG
ncbi:hypothetical protein QC764_503785 [Podospora pseudoanserina]|uniref:Uncharacterized protein n=1 Tax=Podospora pseudoanserina TaxID=2609844 RepID=A0ABR0I4S1_9PEZI|nr:hypothetical protein QC764_503785 [Podospora pseudoanserina]